MARIAESNWRKPELHHLLQAGEMTEMEGCWHISRDKPALMDPLCGESLFPGMAVLRLSEYEAQVDPWIVFGSPVCDPCARAAAAIEPDGEVP